MSAQAQALAIIRNEHQTLAAVIDALEHVAGDVAAGRLDADYPLLWSILYYIEEFPEAMHHPKEEQQLFPRIRQRCHDIDATLDELGRQHAGSRAPLDALKSLLGRMQAEIPGAAQAFSDHVKRYAHFHFEHMALEESVVLPKAAQVLTEADWQAVAAAFADNGDPLLGGAAHSNAWFRQFYRRIVTLVPEPWGLGERHPAASPRAG